jgi:hypothetical protein
VFESPGICRVVHSDQSQLRYLNYNCEHVFYEDTTRTMCFAQAGYVEMTAQNAINWSYVVCRGRRAPCPIKRASRTNRTIRNATRPNRDALSSVWEHTWWRQTRKSPHWGSRCSRCFLYIRFLLMNSGREGTGTAGWASSLSISRPLNSLRSTTEAEASFLASTAVRLSSCTYRRVPVHVFTASGQ